jgi:uncharacterized Zn finger protein
MAGKTMFASLISKAGLKKLAGEKYFELGLDYFENGAVVHLRLGENGIFARVQGTEACPYAVRFWIEKQELQWGCACPLGTEGAFCKHLVATGLAWLSGKTIADDAVAPEDLEAIRDFLEAIDEQTVLEILSQRAPWDESLLAELALAARASQHEDKTGDTRRRNSATSKRQTNKGKPSSAAD